MRLKILFAAAILIAPAVATAALASHWYRVAIGDTAAWYVDLDSVKPNGQWTAGREYSVNFQVSPRGVKTAWSDIEVDCKAHTMRYLRFNAYDENGAQKASMENPDQGKIHPVEGGTVSAGIADFICNVDRSTAVLVADPLTDNPPRH